MRAAENSASAPLNLDEARGVVRAVAPVVLAEFETALAKFDLDERKIGSEAAIDPSAGGNPIAVNAAQLEHIFRAAVAGKIDAVISAT